MQDADTKRTGPLQGIRIVDTTSVVFGAYATQLLADLGADVIKVEFSDARGGGGDVMRWAGDTPNGASGMGPIFMTINRNKRSVLLDLRKSEDLDKFKALLATAHVFATSVRYAGLERLGLDYESVKKIKADIIFVHGSGFGSGGAYANRPAYDDLIQSSSGMGDLLSHTDGDPTPRFLPTLVADKVAGLFMAQAITAALFHWQATKVGQFVEVPMYEVATSFNLVEHFFGHTFDPPTGQWTYWRITNEFRRPHKTSDGYITILPYDERQWRMFFGFSDLGSAFMEDDRFKTDVARRRNVKELYKLMGDVTSKKTTQEWLDLLLPLGVPVAQLNRMEDLPSDEHLKSVEFFQRRNHPVVGDYFVTQPPVKYSETPATIYRDAPMLGEHTDEVLAEVSKTQRSL